MKKLLIAVIILFAACAKKPAPVNTAPQYYTHTISSQGETLASIAKWYTGSASNWQAILAYNPGLDVKRMRIGTQVQIPNNMLIRTAVMPKAKSNQPTLAKSQEVEVLPPSQDSLANSQSPGSEINSDPSTTAAVTEEFPQSSDTVNTDTTYTEQVNNDFDSGQQEYTGTSQEDEVIVKQLTPEEIAALKAEAEESPQKKSILTKFQEAAMKAQEKSLNGGEAGNSAASADSTSQQTNEQAKAAMDAANAQAQAAKEQAAKAVADAQKQNADAQENAAKTRDDLIKELTQDY